MEGKGKEKESEEWDSSVSSSLTGAMYNYVVTAQKPTAVTHSVVGNFSDASGDLFTLPLYYPHLFFRA